MEDGLGRGGKEKEKGTGEGERGRWEGRDSLGRGKHNVMMLQVLLTVTGSQQHQQLQGVVMSTLPRCA